MEHPGKGEAQGRRKKKREQLQPPLSSAAAGLGEGREKSFTVKAKFKLSLLHESKYFNY